MLSRFLGGIANSISHLIRHLFTCFLIENSSIECQLFNATRIIKKRVNISQDMAQTMSKGQEALKIFRQFCKWYISLDTSSFHMFLDSKMKS